MTQKIFSVWEGVYNSFAEAGGDLDAFDSDIWVDKQKSRIYSALEDYNTKNTISKDYPLPLVVAMALSQKEQLKILDFGGVMGLQYLEMISKAPESQNTVDYYVLDGKTSIDNRPKELNQFSKLHFMQDIDDINFHVDIIHIGSTLQYIEDWEELLQSLVNKFAPKYFVFSDLMAGDIPMFVSHQIFYDKRIPVVMFSLNDIKNLFKEMFFKNIYQSSFDASILGSAELPNYALPEELRLKYSRNIIFTK
jgi:putative methyltransferase (TIGR04325 family)